MFLSFNSIRQCLRTNNKINSSLFDEGISFLIMADPINVYNDFSLKVYDPYDEVNNYRYINVVLEREPSPVPVPVPAPDPSPVIIDEPVRPVVDTCAR